MFGNNRVVWKEGMFLQPQHFQQAERGMLQAFNARLAAHFPYSHGFTECVVSTDALLGGTVAVTRAAGVMPDGTPFDIPGDALVPDARPFEERFAPQQQSLAVFLALPLLVEGRGNVRAEADRGADASRMRSRTITVTDEVLGAQKKDIEVGELHFAVLFEGESRDNYTTLPLARLARDQAGQIRLDDSFVPPLLHVGASLYLMNEMRSLLEILLAKNASLSQGRRQRASGLAEFGGAEETAFRLLQTINTFTPLLNHCHVAPAVHPFELFSLMTQFGGALCTFSSEVSIRQLPRYDHTAFGDVFAAFSRIIRTVMGADLASASVPVPIEETGPATYVGTVPDQRLLDAAKFYFGVSAAVPEKELVVGTLQRIKMCSRDRLELLIPSAMPGLPLIHTSRPPEALSTKPGYVYFTLDQGNDFWQGIRSSGTIAFYFPNSYPDLKMELLALRE
ncbi:MAG: type VI secretion system baseplate subunit TssK [Chitinivibrionales bacterium]|nr:type VI secretion system baseplate subunit TssK [Chitinivibrionales bacterium]MBD3397138.1 type VI secretion system baseplate subunit TssK [Chitinivibrionales bacterium]